MLLKLRKASLGLSLELIIGKEGAMKDKKHTHCIWADLDIGVAHMDSIEEFAELVPFGGHVPSKTGTEAEIKQLLARISRRPYLIEKLFKR